MKKLQLPRIKLNINKEVLVKKCSSLALCFLVLSIFSQIVVTNKFAVKGSEMVELQDQKADLENEVSLLKLKASELSSMANVEVRAESLGFVEYSSPIAVISSSHFTASR